MNIPQTNEFRVIIPLKGFFPIYDLTNFDPRQLGNRVTREQVEKVINDICSPFTSYKGMAKKILACLIGPIIVGIVVAILSFLRAPLGIWNFVILVGAVILGVLAVVLCLKRLKVNYKNVMEVITKYEEQYRLKHLKWIVPKDCLWLELWIEQNPDGVNNDQMEITSSDAVDIEVRTAFSIRDLESPDMLSLDINNLNFQEVQQIQNNIDNPQPQLQPRQPQDPEIQHQQLELQPQQSEVQPQQQPLQLNSEARSLIINP